MRYLLGLREVDGETITIAPALPQALRKPGASYRLSPLSWGHCMLAIECQVEDASRYTLRLSCSTRQKQEDMLDSFAESEQPQTYTTEWQAAWGEGRTLRLPLLSQL